MSKVSENDIQFQVTENPTTGFRLVDAYHKESGHRMTVPWEHDSLTKLEDIKKDIAIQMSFWLIPGIEVSIPVLQAKLHEWAIGKEWRGPKSTDRPLVADLALFTSEISEALEELRKNADPLHYYETYTVTWKGVKFANMTEQQLDAMGFSSVDMAELVGKPEGFGPEIADLVIRVLETCEEYGIDLAAEIDRKMNYNAGRPVKHGGLLM